MLKFKKLKKRKRMWNVSEIEELKLFGINTDNQTTEEINTEVLKKLRLLASVAEFNEKEQFQKEIKRLLKPTN